MRKIQRLMDFWRIEPQELEGPAPNSQATVKVTENHAEEQRTQAPQIYRHPRYGQVWDGQGQQPQWLKDALIQEGYTVAELRAVD